VAVSLRGTTVSAGAEYKFLQVIATNHGTGTARDVTLDITITPVAGPNRIEVLETAEELDCVPAGENRMRCDLGDIPAGTKSTVGLPYRAVAGATANLDAGDVTATVSTSSPDDDAGNDTVHATLAILAPASDVLVVADDIHDAVPGTITLTSVAVGNFGATATGPVELTVDMPTGTTIVGDLQGCVRSVGHRSLTCRYDSLTASSANSQNAVDFLDIPVVVDASLVGPRTLIGGTAVLLDDPAAVRTLSASPAGTASPARTAAPVRTAALRNPGSAARRAALAGDADDSDNSDVFVATVAPVANLAVTTRAVRVSGTTATVPFTVRSTGPAVATGVYALVTAPSGTTFAGTPAGCARSGRTLRCDLADRLAPGGSVAGSFMLTVTGTSVGRNGLIRTGSDGVDPVRANNAVRIQVAVPAAPPVQGRLAFTGTWLGQIVAAGGILLLLGGALVLVARRRGARADAE
jgi:hypothetical protein